MTDRNAKPSGTGKAIVHSTNAGDVPAGYGGLLEDLKTRIREAQVKAALSVNRELITLYWHIGRSIVERQRTEAWGRKVVDRLARDLQLEFPGMAGFSPRNVWRMRAFYLAWTEEVFAQPVQESDREILPQAVAEIPWGHNVWLLEKLKDPTVRLWYARQTVANGWSRAMLTALDRVRPPCPAGQGGHQLQGRAARSAVGPGR